MMSRFRNLIRSVAGGDAGAQMAALPVSLGGTPALAISSRDRRRDSRVSASKRLALVLGISILPAIALAAGEQECSPADLAPVDSWLAKHPWQAGKTSTEALVTAACKRSPVDSDVLIVAAAYVQDDDDKNEIVALVDTRARLVRAAFTGTIAEDTITRVGSFRIDTARYELAPGVRAFGVDFSSIGHASGASEFIRSGPERTLFVQQGTTLRPVLVGFALTTWNALPERERRGELSNWTIEIGTTQSHGLFDLVAIRTTEPDQDGTPALIDRNVLHFDGKTYGYANPGESSPRGPRSAASTPKPP